MNIEITPFLLEGCKCRLKFDPSELREQLHKELTLSFEKQKKLGTQVGRIKISGQFQGIDEGNFAIHFMLAFLGKAWITGNYKVERDSIVIFTEEFRISGTFAAFTGGRGQLKGDISLLAKRILKNTLKALKT